MAKKLFVNAKTEAGLNAAVAEGTLNAEVAFLEEQGNEGIHAKGKTYQTIPSNGKDGQILMASNGKGVWTDLDVLDGLSYGVKWNPNVSDPALTRVGNPALHKSLPIQSGMRGCIYNPTEKKVVCWLNPNDWNNDGSIEVEMTSSSEASSAELYGDIKLVIHSEEGENFTNSATHGSEVKICDVLVSSLQIRFVNGDIVLTGQLESPIPSGTPWSLSGVYVGSGGLSDLWGLKNTGVKKVTFTLSAEKRVMLNGYLGEVMVYVPGFYIKSWDELDRREVRISTIKIDESWEYQPPVFLGAYRDTVLNTVPEDMGYLSTLPANTAVSVANSEAYCRGGNNSAANDADEDIFKRQLGKCRINISRATFRTYARNAGKEIMSYRQYKNIMYWLYVIEYANFNSQAPYNAELTVEGFHQGGLGNGLTNVSNWGEYNGYYPISPNGYTNEFGNGTGIKLIEPGGPAPVGSVYATRWRGLENPFGDVWHNVDGIIIDADADNHPNNMNYVYTTDDPLKYGNTVSDIANMVLSGLEVHAGRHTKEWDLGTTAEIIPRLIGGNTTQYKCDYHWTGSKNTKLRTLLLGGGANTGGDAGLGGFNSNNGVGYSGIVVGFRTSCAVDA